MSLNNTHGRKSQGAKANFRIAELKRLTSEGLSLSKAAKLLGMNYSLAKTYMTL